MVLSLVTPVVRGQRLDQFEPVALAFSTSASTQYSIAPLFICATSLASLASPATMHGNVADFAGSSSGIARADVDKKVEKSWFFAITWRCYVDRSARSEPNRPKRPGEPAAGRIEVAFDLLNARPDDVQPAHGSRVEPEDKKPTNHNRSRKQTPRTQRQEHDVRVR